MTKLRSIEQVRSSRPTREGAGVHLQRVFGEVSERLDPFLLLDHFGSDRPEDYLAGFPWHPHRGIETITYMLSGRVEHADSLGNKGEIGPGDVQWMTAGSGIVHQEMPKRSKKLEGFQLWSNLPRADKMMSPRYRDVAAATIPIAELGPGVTAKVICGKLGEVVGPVQDIVTDPTYVDVSLESEAELRLPISPDHNAFAYLFRGQAEFTGRTEPVAINQQVIFGGGEGIRIRASEKGARFLLVSGRPIREPVAWGGPIVMNTQEELRRAFQEYEDGTFIKDK